VACKKNVGAVLDNRKMLSIWTCVEVV